MSWETVIGLEVHAQLSTSSKLFCSCATGFGAPQNSHTCEVCLGMPGALPVVNRRAVELAVRVALALDCDVHAHSGWARKSYFYPDLAKGYQITQFDRPLATGGRLEVGSATVGITRIHMEEDAGKTRHDHLGGSCVDFNRGGVPLVEIVSEPDLSSGSEAAAYLKALRQLLRALGACDGNMEQGSLRCDANVSIRESGSGELGTRTELKNLNSFKFIAQAIDAETARQIERVESGVRVVQQTRSWDPKRRSSATLRAKEQAHDYRYFAEPDLPDLILEPLEIERARGQLPELPGERRKRFRALGLSDYDAGVLTEDADVADYFEVALAAHDNPKAIANWVSNDLLRERKERSLAELPVSPESLAALVALVDDGVISNTVAKTVFEEMVATGGAPEAIVRERGLEQVDDDAALEPIVDEVIAANPESVTAFRGGKNAALGPLVGQVMKRTGGKANPRRVQELLRERLGS